mgnify:CR=1 FL=1
MSFEEACFICATVYGSAFSYTGGLSEEDYFVCPECGEPILADDYPAHDFSECPICGFRFKEDEE